MMISRIHLTRIFFERRGVRGVVPVTGSPLPVFLATMSNCPRVVGEETVKLEMASWNRVSMYSVF
jgi:hypothetical protein